jgi:hypothetical protein
LELTGRSAGDFETLQEATERWGYASDSSLRAAFHRGDIEGYVLGRHMILLLKESVSRYASSRNGSGGRGKSRKGGQLSRTR